VRPRVALTAGDPAGIGPEIVRKAAADPRVLAACEPVFYGAVEPDAAGRFPPGVLSADAGGSAYEAIVAAVEAALAGRVDAIATAPVNKEAFALAGLPWKGHTDLLGALTRAPRAVMMFDSPTLRVSLATVHIPLSDVPRALTAPVLGETIRITADSLPDFGFAAPRLAVAGLNPHAGEHGLMGREDDEVLSPTVAACVREGYDVVGPIPGDTVFLRASRGEFDAVIACYHDQGLIPVKLLSFGQSVNVTLGLPIVRTSVDHGTAFDIAGQDRADPSSMVEAVLLAARLATNRRARSLLTLSPTSPGRRRVAVASAEPDPQAGRGD
jgi:4-hydroxythreonine-4-phosphate dehydrogenase